MNPLLNAMGKTAPAMGGVNTNLLQVAQSMKRMMGMLKTVQNPQAALMQVAQQNPQLNAVMQLVGNRNPQEVFAEQCKQHGVNPDDAIKQIQQMLS